MVGCKEADFVVVVDFRLFSTEFHQSILFVCIHTSISIVVKTVGEDSFRSSKQRHPILSVRTKFALCCFGRCTMYHKQPSISTFFDRHTQQFYRSFFPFHNQTIPIWMSKSNSSPSHSFYSTHEIHHGLSFCLCPGQRTRCWST